ncbi:hypothetical protein SAMN06297421_103119 [Aristaeella hokkaidonensis]|nr:hypothetical protein SAMN06297421_103119 [Aristaeella hokkaidonensis]
MIWVTTPMLQLSKAHSGFGNSDHSICHRKAMTPPPTCLYSLPRISSTALSGFCKNLTVVL